MDVVDKSNCDQAGGQLKFELNIVVTNATRWNRTPVQCVAQASTHGQSNFFSPYSVLLVEPLPPGKIHITCLRIAKSWMNTAQL